jgi:hypothetical protein
VCRGKAAACRCCGCKVGSQLHGVYVTRLQLLQPHHGYVQRSGRVQTQVLVKLMVWPCLSLSPANGSSGDPAYGFDQVSARKQ